VREVNRQLIEDVEKARRRIILGLFVAITVFIVFEALRGEQFWNKLKSEGNLWNYGSSLVFFMAGQGAILTAILLSYQGRGSNPRPNRWVWLPWAVAGAALVFLACDEMLSIHEKLGLALERSVPRLQEAYPGHADNLIVGVYALGALLFAPSFFRGDASDRRARAYLIAGFAMIAAAGLLDALPKEMYIRYLPFRETEELLEVYAGFSLNAAFFSTAALALTRILRAQDDESREAAPVGVSESGRAT